MGVAAEIVVICSLWRTRMRIRAEGEGKKKLKKKKKEGKKERVKNKRGAEQSPLVSRLYLFRYPHTGVFQKLILNK